MTIRFVANLALALILVGCACTAEGCANAVSFALPFDVERNVAYDIRTCFDDECTEEVLALDGSLAQTGALGRAFTLWVDTDLLELHLGDGDFGGPHRVTMTIRDDTGASVASFQGDVELERSKPNGAFCEPTCWSTRIDL